MDLKGVYYDPLHGGCVRVVTQTDERNFIIKGVYGDDEPPYHPGEVWIAKISADGLFLTVDFTNKAVNHERIYSALWCPSARKIAWQDGNVWTKLYS